MPKAMMEKMRRGGVRNPYAMLNAAGYEEGDSEEKTKKKLSTFMKAHKYLKKRK